MEDQDFKMEELFLIQSLDLLNFLLNFFLVLKVEEQASKIQTLQLLFLRDNRTLKDK